MEQPMTPFPDMLASMLGVARTETGGMYIWGISIRTWSLVVAFPCVIVATLISVISMLRHCSRNKDPEIRRHLLRILFMVPIYAINAVCSLLWPFQVELFTLIRETYEAITIYSLAHFLFLYLGGESRLKYLLSLDDQATDEYHLYRLAQNLANKSTITLANSNFISHEPHTHTAEIDTIQANTINHNQELVRNDSVTASYASNYRLKEWEKNKAWYKRLPFIRSFFPPPDFHGKSTFDAIPVHYAPPVDPTFEEQRANLKKKHAGGQIDHKSPLLSPSSSSPSLLSSSSASSSSSSTNSNIRLNNNPRMINNNNTLSFQTRPTTIAIQAIDEDRENFQRFKKKQQLRSALKSKQDDASAMASTPQADASSLGALNSSEYSPPINPSPQLRSRSGDGDDDANGDDFSLGRLPTNKNNNNNNHHAVNIATSPPGEPQARLEVDPNIPNKLIEHDADDAQVLVTKHLADGTERQYLQDLNDLHGSSSLLTSSQIQQRIVTLEYHPQLASIQRTYPHMFPFNHLFEPVSASRFLFISKFSILQYVPIQIFCAVIAMIGHSTGIYHPGSWTFRNLYPYLSIVINSSQMAALYGLFWFLHSFEKNLKGINAMGKALVIKSCVFATFWQSCAISIYYAFFPWCSEDGKPRHCEEGEWDSEKQAAAINSFLICLEMFFFAFLHLKFFSWREFGRPLMYDKTKPVFRSLIEFFSPTDIMSEVKTHMNMGNVRQVLFPTQLPPGIAPPATTPDDAAKTSDDANEITESQDGAVIKLTFHDDDAEIFNHDGSGYQAL